MKRLTQGRSAALAAALTLTALTAAALTLAPGDTASAQGAPASRPAGKTASAPWQRELAKTLPALGHRNWIVVADSAYPAQTSPGVKTLVTGDDQLDVVKEVVALLDKQPHVTPTVQVDKELSYVPEKSAPGITDYRNGLNTILKGQQTTPVLHEDLIKRLDQTGQKFNVIILKTKLTLPYTSVFFELGAKYWDADREAELRKLMGQK